MTRKIIHVDMDAFYASVEQRDNPGLAGRPVAVGGSAKGRGVVMAASYEARRFGIRSAMPAAHAARKCPDLIFVKPRFDVYKTASDCIRAIFDRYTALVEPLSLDEAYLDVTETLEHGSATAVARRIKREIRDETLLTASAGVSYNKFLAKVASGWKKPDGLTVVRPDDAIRFIALLPIEKFYGVGAVTARRLREKGIATGADLQTHTERSLTELLGKAGAYYYNVARGVDDRQVRSSRHRKSLGAERTFEEDVSDVAEMRSRLAGICDRVWERLSGKGYTGMTVTVKIKYLDFQISTRSVTMKEHLASARELRDVADRLLTRPGPPERAVRLLGVSISNLGTRDNEAPRQLQLDLGALD